ncbi:MAG TPA: prolyl oligopeptidase family serine peptidase [Vicinamibacterales bacterium]|nr:prolyl oligopeptidase family serine peptidase [Vicinamibacterales bacterium]
MRANSVGIAVAALFLLAGAAGQAQRSAGPSVETKPGPGDPNGRFELTVDTIMRGPDLVGYPPTGLRWSADSQKLYFDWRKPGEDKAATYMVARDGGTPTKLTDDEVKYIPPASGRWDKAHRRVLFVDGGDVVVVDATSGTRRQITRTAGAESAPRWARNDTHVTWVRDGNLYIAPVDSGTSPLLSQLTDVAPRRPDPRPTDSQRFIRDEEEKLIDFLEKQKAEKKKAEEDQKKTKLPSFELQDRQTAADLMLAPDDTHVFIVVNERAVGVKNTIVPNYVTESGYTEDIPGRSNVGDTQDRRLLAILNLRTGKSVWADGSFAPPVAPEEEKEEKPAAAAATAPDGRPGRRAERDIRWSMPAVSEDGKHVVAAARSADNKDRWIVTLDPETGATKVLDLLHDDAWVREGSFSGSPVTFLPDSSRVLFLSERDGWMHLYTLDVANETAKPEQLTAGKWEVAAVDLSRDGKTFYITSSEVHPGERHLYAMPVAGGQRTRITSMAGSNEAEVSPDGSTLGLVFSYSNKPPEVYVMRNAAGAEAKQVTTTPTEAWRSFKWIDPKVITFKARDGVDVYARLFTPEMIGAKRDAARPGVIFVHGAGYLQNAHKYWSTYYREYMFHNLLAARGYVVLDVDYRASSGYGRDWRTAIYRHMGGKDLEDIVDGAKYLTAAERVDAKRIGVYGGSYGGFITLMAMFTTPDVFAAGAALRPVTDWAHYNHGYTSNILNVPQKDADAYRKSSPIYFAEGLKGALLICHGMVDTNVHFQDSVRLAQRLIELRKENWELAAYPVENHGFTEETSWADEYKRILKLFEEHLRTRGGKGTN